MQPLVDESFPQPDELSAQLRGDFEDMLHQADRLAEVRNQVIHSLWGNASLRDEVLRSLRPRRHRPFGTLTERPFTLAEMHGAVAEIRDLTYRVKLLTTITDPVNYSWVMSESVERRRQMYEDARDRWKQQSGSHGPSAR